MNSVVNLILERNFPCTMAKSVLGKDNIVFKTYDMSDDVAADFRQDLGLFHKSCLDSGDEIRSFVAEFDSKSGHFIDFIAFENYFWDLLTRLRQKEFSENVYDSTVSSDPFDKKFGFSVNGAAYFFILLHPENPRLSRRSAKPAVVCNLHSQFELLRQQGVFHKLKKIIRGRDKKLQGNENPMMKDFGNSPEWLQYTGSEKTRESKCPFARLLGK